MTNHDKRHILCTYFRYIFSRDWAQYRITGSNFVYKKITTGNISPAYIQAATDYHWKYYYPV